MNEIILTADVTKLGSIRNQYNSEQTSLKKKLLQNISPRELKSKVAIQEYYHHLLFLTAYPDNREIHQLATDALRELWQAVRENENLQYKLANTGLNGSAVCAAFSFELTKWLKARFPEDVALYSMDADEGQISAILSVVMPKVESEILQDENDDWKSWLKQMTPPGKDLLDSLIALFDQSDLRPEVKDELWNSLLINTTTQMNQPVGLPKSLYQPYYHRSLIRKAALKEHAHEKPKQIKLSTEEAAAVIDSGRLVLLRHIREIDPVTFSQPEMVAYYQLSRGLTVALFGMVHDRRHPIDNYLGYVAFKNGQPVAYAGSWLLFDSGRIGLNVFPAYRGGESQYLFGQVIELHRQVYRLKRFSVDPYQIGKHNHDGIQSGAFWIYYSLGFVPLKKEQRDLAEKENIKRQTLDGYRCPDAVLKKLADSRLELILEGKPVRWDATDLSRVYAQLVKDRYNGNRKAAGEQAFDRMAKLLHLKKVYHNQNLRFVLQNWSLLLAANEKALRANKSLQRSLRKMFALKATGSEEDYLKLMREEKELRKWLEEMILPFDK